MMIFPWRWARTLGLLSWTLLSDVGIRVSAANSPEGQAYLDANALKPDVQTWPSGLQVRVLASGDGAFHPVAHTACSCHYTGTLIDGTVFDSSRERGTPSSFAPNQVIAGWTEALQRMVVGDRWELTIPADLAYGEAGRPPTIPAQAVLIFDLELVDIVGPDTIVALRCDWDRPEDTCTGRERLYRDKVADWDPARVEQERARLEKLLDDAQEGRNTSKNLQEWMRQRLHLLQQKKERVQRNEGDKEEEEDTAGTTETAQEAEL